MRSYLSTSDKRLRQIYTAAEEDESLQLLRHVILTGWLDSKDHIPAKVIPYFHFRDELSVQDGLIFKGERVVIPQSIRRDMLKPIHSYHIGVEGCLLRACACLDWPRMSAEMKEHISTCETCRTYETKQHKETLMSHKVPQRP